MKTKKARRLPGDFVVRGFQMRLEGLKRFDQSDLVDGEEEHLVLTLSNFHKLALSSFQNSDVLSLLARALEAKDRYFLTDER